jgi:hypothetical protein
MSLGLKLFTSLGVISVWRAASVGGDKTLSLTGKFNLGLLYLGLLTAVLANFFTIGKSIDAFGELKL